MVRIRDMHAVIVELLCCHMSELDGCSVLNLQPCIIGVREVIDVADSLYIVMEL